MDVAVKIADRDALPVWTIPYVTEWDIYPDMLLEMLVSPNKHASAFPSAFNLDRESCPHSISSKSWIDTQTSISDLEDELEEMEISERERRDRWRMESINIIMKAGCCYIWLDEFTKWLESRKDCDQEILMRPSDNGQGFTIYHIELSLTPLLLPEHELYFQNTELSKIDKVISDEIPSGKKTTLKTTKKRINGTTKERTTKLNIWLREKWDEWDKPNARDFAYKLKPLQGTMNCPVKKFYGWHPAPNPVCEWKLGWGSTSCSWQLRAFENKVDDFKRQDREDNKKKKNIC